MKNLYSINRFLVWWLGIGISLLFIGRSNAQQSPNTVKFRVTYDPTSQVYTTWVVPDYATPNSNNRSANELVSTAQVTLKVPIGFVIQNITDASGTQNWEKDPVKLGPGLNLATTSGTIFVQDYSPAVLDPNYAYYVIGKAPTESNLGPFAIGVPVPLFSFKGNGCSGPIQAMPPGDAFIQAAYDTFSYNVPNSFYSSSGQPAGGNQEPLEQFISISGPAASCQSVPVTLAILGPIPGTTVASLNPPISGTATPGSSVTVTGPNGQSCVVVAATPSGSWTCSSLTFVNGPALVTALASLNGITGTPVVNNFAISVPVPPSVTSDVAITTIGTPVSGNVLTNDNNPQGGILTVSLVGPPISGTVTLSPTGGYTYTPPSGFTGTTGFCYLATNTAGLSASTCVTVTIVPNPVIGNNKPIAINDATQTTVGMSVTIAVLANDSDPDSATTLNGQLTPLIQVSQPSIGTAVVNTNGVVVYTPPTGFVGVVSFPYQVCDKATTPLCTTALVTVNILPLPPVGTTLSPVAIDDAFLVKPNTPLVGSVSTNDSDPSGLTLTYTSGQPTSGGVVMSPTGSYTYTPAPGFTGPVSFTYSVCNTAGRCDVATANGLIQSNPLLVSLLPKVYLQGALINVYSPNMLMRDDLRVGGFLPANHPYSGWSPVTAVGTLTSSVASVTGANAIVDWVFVELRSPSSSSVVVDSRAALLQRDGDIVDVDGVSPLTFSRLPLGSYYVAVRHRNHLGVMSQTAIPFSGTTTVIDFRQLSTPTYTYTGTSSYSQVTIDQAQVVVDQGVAMWAGNALRDGEGTAPHDYVIYQGSNNDINMIYQQVINPPGFLITPYTVRRGYLDGDINLDGRVIFQGTQNDIEYIYQNIIKNHPGNSLVVPYYKIREQLP